MFQEKETGATFCRCPCLSTEYNYSWDLQFVPRNIVVPDIGVITENDISVHDLTSFHRYSMYPICISKRKFLDQMHQQGEHVGQAPPEKYDSKTDNANGAHNASDHQQRIKDRFHQRSRSEDHPNHADNELKDELEGIPENFPENPNDQNHQTYNNHQSSLSQIHGKPLLSKIILPVVIEKERGGMNHLALRFNLRFTPARPSDTKRPWLLSGSWSDFRWSSTS